MTPEERWQKIEEKHAALAETVEILGGMQRAAEARQDATDARMNTLTASVVSTN